MEWINKRNTITGTRIKHAGTYEAKERRCQQEHKARQRNLERGKTGSIVSHMTPSTIAVQRIILNTVTIMRRTLTMFGLQIVPARQGKTETKMVSTRGINSVGGSKVVCK
jgi:hypothetical protein